MRRPNVNRPTFVIVFPRDQEQPPFVFNRQPVAQAANVEEMVDAAAKANPHCVIMTATVENSYRSAVKAVAVPTIVSANR